MSTLIRPAHRARPAASVLGTMLLATVAAGCAFLPGPTTSPAASPASPPASPAPSQSAAPPGPLVSVETRGGMCLGGTSGAIVVLGTDGRVRTAAKPPNELGAVAAEDLAGLTALIEATDFVAIRAHPFTGTCPVAYDGQEVVYEFTTSDAVERIESCVTEVDSRHPLFVGVTAVLGEFISLPLE